MNLGAAEMQNEILSFFRGIRFLEEFCDLVTH